MSISIVSQPDDICLVRQPAPLVASTNNYITTPGVKAKIFIEFTADCSNGDTIVFAWNGNSITFTCAVVPGSDVTKFLVNGGGDPLDDWAQSNFIDYLNRNGLLYDDFDITLDPSSNSTYAKIKVEARRTGSAYTLTVTNGLTNSSNSGAVSGVTEVVRNGMKLTMDVYAEDVYGSNLFELAGKTEANVLSDSKAVFYLDRILYDFGRSRYFLPSVSLTGYTNSNLMKQYFFTLQEKYGSPPALYNLYNPYHSKKKYLLGGFNFGAGITNAFTSGYITNANGKKFLTKKPRKRITSTTQKEYLYMYLNSGLSTVALKVTAYDLSNTSLGSAYYATYSTPAEGVMCFSVGYTQLGVESLFSSTPVYRYKVQLVINGSVFTEEVEYIVNRDYHYTSETLYYVNGFGVTETLWVNGSIEQQADMDRQDAERLRLYNDGVEVGEYTSVNPTHRNSYVVNAGYLVSFAEDEWVVDLLNTVQLWWYKDSQFLPMKVTDKATPAFTKKQNVRPLSFKMTEAFEQQTA